MENGWSTVSLNFRNILLLSWTALSDETLGSQIGLMVKKILYFFDIIGLETLRVLGKSWKNNTWFNKSLLVVV